MVGGQDRETERRPAGAWEGETPKSVMNKIQLGKIFQNILGKENSPVFRVFLKEKQKDGGSIPNTVPEAKPVKSRLPLNASKRLKTTSVLDFASPHTKE